MSEFKNKLLFFLDNNKIPYIERENQSLAFKESVSQSILASNIGYSSLICDIILKPYINQSRVDFCNAIFNRFDQYHESLKIKNPSNIDIHNYDEIDININKYVFGLKPDYTSLLDIQYFEFKATGSRSYDRRKNRKEASYEFDLTCRIYFENGNSFYQYSHLIDEEDSNLTIKDNHLLIFKYSEMDKTYVEMLKFYKKELGKKIGYPIEDVTIDHLNIFDILDY